MILSTKNRFIFCHIPRTAGKSIFVSLFPYSDYYKGGHYNMGEIKNKLLDGWEIYRIIEGESNEEVYNIKHRVETVLLRLSEQGFNNYYKFSFIRNPYSREVSRYLYARKKPEHPKSKYAQGSFKEWLKWVCKNDVQLQFDKLTDKDGNWLINNAFDYENINFHFDFLCEKFGLETELPHLDNLDKGGKKRDDWGKYKKYYDEESKKLIRSNFKKDLEEFDYDF